MQYQIYYLLKLSAFMMTYLSKNGILLTLIYHPNKKKSRYYRYLFIKVSNRSIFVPINADTELSKPDGLQAKINEIVSQYSKGRSFVRPSGTEDIVRVYSEAETNGMTADLSNRICGLVFDNYGGVGERPSSFM